MMAKTGKNYLYSFGKYALAAITVVSLFFNFYLLFTSGQKDKLTSEKKQVLRIIDGDTFDIEGDVRVRLAGADAPEYPEGCLATQSKQRLTELLTGKTVTLQKIGKDNFGRSLAYTYADNLFIDKTMVEEGLAYATADNYPKYASLLETAEETAKSASRSVWSSSCQKPPSSNCRIKGNIRQGFKTKIYHMPACYNYEKIVVNEKDGDRWFCSEKEAQAEGFRLSADCPESS